MRRSPFAPLATTLVLALGAGAGCGLVDLLVPAEELGSEAGRESAPEPTADQRRALVEGNTAFALELYGALARGDESSNLFFSPHGISVSLAMVYAGARGETARQMAEALHFTLSAEELHPAFDWLDLTLESRGSGARDGERFRLSLANALWGQEGYRFLAGYLDLLEESYGGGLRLLDFASEPERSRLAINDWAAGETDGRIEDLLAPGAIDRDTRLVVTSAISFEAGWASRFGESRTAESPFRLPDGGTVWVPTMRQAAVLPYAELQGHQAVELPYEGGEVSMVVLLPAAGQLGAFEAALDPGLLAATLESLAPERVELALPRFAFEARLELAGVLRGLGLELAFADRADLGGMVEGGGVRLSEVVHSTFVAVDERGTEAAAATGVVMEETSLPPPGVPMEVDRPFVFLVRDLETGAVIFFGRVADPTG